MNETNTGEVLAEAVRQAARLASTTPHPPSRVLVRDGEILVEVEWPPTNGATNDTAAGEPLSTVSVEPVALTVDAPMVGVFYRAAQPGEEPFVSVGDIIREGQTVGILEVMKMMNNVEANHAGRVVEVLVADGTSVEFAQPLITLAPLDAA